MRADQINFLIREVVWLAYDRRECGVDLSDIMEERSRTDGIGRTAGKLKTLSDCFCQHAYALGVTLRVRVTRLDCDHKRT
jgi:hypothetical protein